MQTAMLRFGSTLRARVLGSAGRRHLAAVTRTPPASQINGAHEREATARGATRYVPPGSDGRFLVERLRQDWRSVVAGRGFKEGERIGSAFGTLCPEPTRSTVEITPEKHLQLAGGLVLVNHSCKPNTRLVVNETVPKVSFVAVRAIAQGEHLSFDYATSEWDMDEKFECSCGARSCRGHIGGAKYLSDEEVAARLPLFTPSILRQLLNHKLGN